MDLCTLSPPQDGRTSLGHSERSSWCPLASSMSCFSFFTVSLSPFILDLGIRKKVQGLALPLTGCMTWVKPCDISEAPTTCEPPWLGLEEMKPNGRRTSKTGG